MLSFLTGSLLWKSLTGGGLLGRALGHAALDLKAFGKWLFADTWRLVAFVLAIALALSALHGNRWKSAYTRIHTELVTCNATRDGLKRQLDSISTAKDKQSVVTRDNIVTVTKIVYDADGVARKIENAPPTKDCKTAPEIMGADL